MLARLSLILAEHVVKMDAMKIVRKENVTDARVKQKELYIE
jgi:hypothetical protein